MLYAGITSRHYPGVAYYISLWYPRSERAMRFAIFFSAATVAGLFVMLLLSHTSKPVQQVPLVVSLRKFLFMFSTSKSQLIIIPTRAMVSREWKGKYLTYTFVFLGALISL
jgi:hypothetical protein